MPYISINVDEAAKKILEKRAKKNLMTLREQIEDIVRRSAASTKSGTVASPKIDDKLVAVFSRDSRGRKKKVRKKVKKK